MVLLGYKPRVQQDPSRQRRPHPQSPHYVDLAEQRDVHMRVKLAPNEEAIDNATRVAAVRQLAQMRVAGPHGEATGVDGNGDEQGEGEVGGKQLQIVVHDPCIEEKVGAVNIRADSAGHELRDTGREGLF